MRATRRHAPESASGFGYGLASALWLATAFSSVGCIPFPFATPPAQIELGTSARVQRPSPGADALLDAPLQVRVGANPLGLDRDLLERPFDFTVGYVLDSGRSQQQGGYLDVAAFAYRTHWGDGMLRLALHGQGRLLYDHDVHELGESGVAQISFEYAAFTNGPFDSTNGDGGFFGYAWGEAGVGLYLEGAYSAIGPERIWSAGGGLIMRTPAMAGVGYFWIWAFLR